MADLPQGLEEQIRAHLASGRPPCEALCAPPAWDVGERTVLRWPLGASGSTEGGLVPLGPSWVLELAADGVAIRCGEDHGAPVAACPGLPPIDPARVGLWVDPLRPLGPIATDGQGRALWLRDDGTSVRFDPGWVVAYGRWRASAGGVDLDETRVLRGTGGGGPEAGPGTSCQGVDGRPIGVPAATLDRWVRADPPVFDEGFFRRGCVPAAPPPPADAAFSTPPSDGEFRNPFAGARDQMIAWQEASAAPAAPERSMPDGPVRTPALSPPPARACLRPTIEPEGGIEGRGLAPEAVKATLDAFLPRITGCIPGGTHGMFAPVASFTVGCDGRVRDVVLIELDGVPAPVAACLATALRSAPFPAHDRVGGEVFEVPLRFGG